MDVPLTDEEIILRWRKHAGLRKCGCPKWHHKENYKDAMGNPCQATQVADTKTERAVVKLVRELVRPHGRRRG
jgi:hypothetical protein